MLLHPLGGAGCSMCQHDISIINIFNIWTLKFSKNIAIAIDKRFLKNIDIDKEIYENIAIDKILYRQGFGISNTTTPWCP